MAFGQGLPGDFLFSRMQVSIAPMLGIPLMVLVGIVTVMTMGPPNALKPTQIAYTASLANVKGRDGEIFRICLPWQLLQLVVTAILSVILVYCLEDSCVSENLYAESPAMSALTAIRQIASRATGPSLDFQTHLAKLEAQGPAGSRRPAHQ